MSKNKILIGMNCSHKETLKETLNLVEIFASVQGETSFTGYPTTFIRLAACNLRCTWCDTPYSFPKGKAWEIKDVMTEVEKFALPTICVTGGEPLLQDNVHSLLNILCNNGYTVSLETGGSLSTLQVHPQVHIILDIKCPQSGMSHKNYWANLPHLNFKDEVKFVIQDIEDYKYAKEICNKYQLFQKVKNVLFSPVHGLLNPKELVKWILEDRLPIRLNLQMHKYIWDPTTRGV